MMPEISLNLLDIAQNSVKAGASLIRISVIADREKDTLTAWVEDNGCGMDEATIQKVCDPFYTTRTTRKVGLGIPFFKQAAELTGGRFLLESTPSVGTKVTAAFVLSSIDRMPLGDMNSTLLSLIQCNPSLDFCYEYGVDTVHFTFATAQIRQQLGDVPLNTPEVLQFLSEYLQEQTLLVQEKAGGTIPI